MAIITGTAGNDTLAGTSADDTIQGLDGNDKLTGGIGSDRLEGGVGEDVMDGGEGNDLLIGGDDFDILSDHSGGNDELEGGGGADDIRISRSEGAAATVNRMDGGDGRDFFGVYDYSRVSTFNLSGGAGNDYFYIIHGAAVSIDTGAGDDYVELEGVTAAVSLGLAGGSDLIKISGISTAFGGAVTTTGFDPGDGGDSFDFAEYLNLNLAGWDGRSNPFASGYMRLVQSGADALLQVDWNGGGDSYSNFISFLGTSAASLTAFNLGGWPSDGSVPAALTLVGMDWIDDSLAGGAGADRIQGLGGGDRITGGAGDDHLEGGSGQDSLYGGLGDDLIEGGDGNDTLYGDLRGADVLRGGEGDDSLMAFRSVEELGWIELDGGAGNDFLWGRGWQPKDWLPALHTRYRFNGGEGSDRFDIYRVTEAEVDAGAGDDRILLDTYTNATIALGAGSDVLELDELRGFSWSGRTLIVTDFAAGPAGDRIEWSKYLASALAGWNGSNPFGQSPFGTYLRLVQSGADTLVQISPSGSPDGFSTLITLKDVDASALGQFNMGGFPPDGSTPAGGTLLGTADADQLTGSGGSDTIYGFAANDVLNGSSGDDFLYGGDGTDQLIGELGNDRLEGGADMDFLEDRSGGDDSLFGGEGRDSLYAERNGGPPTTLLLDGGADGDWLSYIGSTQWFVKTIVTLVGGEGDDEISVNGRVATATIDAGTGSDVVRLYTDPGRYVVTLGAGSDSLELLSDRLLTGAITVTDFEVGEAGDRLDLDGWFSSALTNWDGLQSPFATGHARLLEAGGSTLLQVDRDGGGDSYSTLLTLSGTSLFFLTSANLGGFDPVTRGTSGADQMSGTAGADMLHAGPGNDSLRLQDGGDDMVFGGAGNDSLFFIGSLTGADVVNGGSGGDTLVLQGPYGALTLTANVTEIENISILAGSNTAFGGASSDRHDYVLTTNDANFAAGVQARINGAALLAGEDFTFDGTAETDASFVVYGGRGRDTLTGGLGNDIFFFAEERFASGDTVNGGAGYNGMFLRGNYTIDFNAPGYTGLFTNIHNLTLTSATDERYARGGGTEFDYNLTLSDAIVGAGGQLTVSGALLLATETMVLDASAETDGTLRLFGGKASDILKGGALNDLLHGNLGADTLAGGGGADAFRFQNVAESSSGSMDQILDFTPGTDRIELDRIDADTLTAGNQAFSWIGSNAFSGTAGELRAYEQSGTWFVEGDTNGDGAADLVIVLTLVGPMPLSASDFLL
jgi:Ca2+-binding RTX toxin-like protein